MKKILKKGLLLGLIALIALLAFLWFDDSLTPLSKEVLAYEVTQQVEDNGEIYIWCFACKASDVYGAGEELVKRANELIQTDGVHEDGFYKHYEYHQFENDDILCEKFANDCDVFELVKNTDVLKFNADNGWAINRYLTYLSHNHFIEQTYPDYDAPLPSYRDLTNAQRTYHLSLLVGYKYENTHQLLLSLTDELIQTKKALRKVDTLIQRMILTALVAENIEFMNQLFQKGYFYETDLSAYEKELNLSQSHHDLTGPYKRDYVIWVNAYADASNLTNIIKDKNASFLKKYIVAQLYKYVYKPNMTTNYITSDLTRPISLTTLPADLFFQRAQTHPPKKAMSQLRNFLGHRALNKVKPSPLYEYTARIHSLHNKMILLKALFDFGDIETLQAALNQPKFPHKNLFNKQPPTIENDHFCFGTLLGIRNRPKDLCLKVVGEHSNNGNTTATDLNP